MIRTAEHVNGCIAGVSMFIDPTTVVSFKMYYARIIHHYKAYVYSSKQIDRCKRTHRLRHQSRETGAFVYDLFNRRCVILERSGSPKSAGL